VSPLRVVVFDILRIVTWPPTATMTVYRLLEPFIHNVKRMSLFYFFLFRKEKGLDFDPPLLTVALSLLQEHRSDLATWPRTCST
jgi:hypothetical protein